MKQQILKNEIIEDMLQMSSEKIYSIYGAWLETIVEREKEKIQLKLKTIWRNRNWYAFKDTGQQFEKDTMLLYFEPKKVKKYKLNELEKIIQKIEAETVYSNPKNLYK